MAKTKKKDETVNTSFEDFIRRQFGEGVMVSAESLVERPREIVPTTLSLDIALSGGIPEGKVVLISGKPKAGKTTLVLHIINNAISMGRKAFYFDIERRCDPSLLRTVKGLDLSKLKIMKSTKEKVLSAEEWLVSLERTIKDNPRSIIAVDSLAMLSTLAEQTEEVGQNKDMAGVPKLMSSFFRKTKDVIDTNNVILIFLNQYQTNRDPASRRKWDEKGGMGVQYQCSVWLNVDWVKPWDKDSATNRPHGHDVMFTVKCSALGPPLIPCAVPLRFGHAIDVARDVAIQAENLGLIERSGAWYAITAFADESGAAPKFQGGEELRRFLNDNPDQLTLLDRKIREIVIPNSLCK